MIYDQSWHKISLEHCSVLQERLAAVLTLAYPEEDLRSIVIDHISPTWLMDELNEMFTPEAFINLFASEMGKGVMLGAFIQEHILNQELKEE